MIDKRDNPHYKSRLSVEQFSIEFDMPMELANCLIGRTEKETEHRIEMLKEYIGKVLKQRRQWLQDDACDINL